MRSNVRSTLFLLLFVAIKEELILDSEEATQDPRFKQLATCHVSLSNDNPLLRPPDTCWDCNRSTLPEARGKEREVKEGQLS